MRVTGLRVDFRALRVLDGIDVEAREGEILSLIGPSGCGKTTLLQVLAGLLPAQAGSVDLAGRSHAMVFQRPTLLPWQTVLDNALFGVACRRAVEPADRVRAQALLASMGLGEHFGARPHTLSQGMQQRVNLARALLVDPDVLLLDEPFAALDPITRRGLWDELLARVAERALTAILVSHSLEEVATLSDRIVVLTDKPTRVAAVVDVDLPRPRPAGAEGRLAVQAIVDRLEVILGAPDVATRANRQRRSTASTSAENDANDSQ